MHVVYPHPVSWLWLTPQPGVTTTANVSVHVAPARAARMESGLRDPTCTRSNVFVVGMSVNNRLVHLDLHDACLVSNRFDVASRRRTADARLGRGHYDSLRSQPPSDGVDGDGIPRRPRSRDGCVSGRRHAGRVKPLRLRPTPNEARQHVEVQCMRLLLHGRWFTQCSPSRPCIGCTTRRSSFDANGPCGLSDLGPRPTSPTLARLTCPWWCGALRRPHSPVPRAV